VPLGTDAEHLRPSSGAETLAGRHINPTAPATPCPPSPLGDLALSTAREEEERGKEEGRGAGGREQARGLRFPRRRPGAAARPHFVEEGGAGGRGRPDLTVPELELPRAPWKPALLRKEDRRTGAPLLPWMPSTSTTTCSAECSSGDLFCFPYLEPNRRRSASPSSPPFTAAARTPR
jgi:hypothetical protein